MTELEQQRCDRAFRLSTHVWIASLVFSIFVAEILALIVAALWLWRRRGEPHTSTALDSPVLLFCLFRLVTIATALSPIASLPALRKIPFMIIFFPLAHFASREKSTGVIKLLRTLIVAAIVASMYGLLRMGGEGFERLHSTTSGPTTLAMLLAAGFVIGLALIACEALKPKKIWLPGLASMFTAMAFTFCRAPWLAACTVGLSSLLTYARRTALLLLIGMIVILALLPGFRMRFAEVLQWPHAMGDRPVIWQKGWELVQARPLLGYGPESFHLLFDRQEQLKDRRVGAWHNFVLQLWVESGLLSVLVFGWIIWKAFYSGRIGAQVAPTQTARVAARALFAGITTLLLAGLFGGFIGDPIIDMLFWGMLGLLAGIDDSRLS
ncbi:MAG: O-antigen ligase family protein [bacterium]